MLKTQLELAIENLEELVRVHDDYGTTQAQEDVGKTLKVTLDYLKEYKEIEDKNE